MNKPTWSHLVILPLISLAAIWGLFFASTMDQPKQVIAAPHDTPERILSFAKSTQSPLILINFWASWCEPCKEELPALKMLNDKYSAQGLKVILVSIDDVEEIAEARSFLAENQIQFPSFYKGTQPLRFVSQIYPKWSGAVPATLLLDRDLKILDAWEGDKTLEEFEQKVMPFLKGKT